MRWHDWYTAIAGFISKWYLGLGAIEVGQSWVVFVLITAHYSMLRILPVLYIVGFCEPDRSWCENDTSITAKQIDTVVAGARIAGMAVAAGLLASLYTPLEWVRFITHTSFINNEFYFTVLVYIGIDMAINVEA